MTNTAKIETAHSDNRIALFSTKTVTHMFLDEKLILTINGHTTDGRVLYRKCSVVDNAEILYQGKSFNDFNPEGSIDPSDFEVIYGDEIPIYVDDQPKIIRQTYDMHL